MKTSIMGLAMLFITSLSFASVTPKPYFTNVTSVTFTIPSTAKTSTANLRLGAMFNRIAQTGNTQPMQTGAIQSITDFFLTKSITVNIKGAVWFLIQVDQNTNMYINNGTDYLTIPSGSNFDTGVYH